MNTILLVGSYNGAEFLAAAQVANNAFKMPAASTGEQTIYNIAAQISVSNTATVSLTVDPDSIVTNAGLKVVTDAQVVKDSAQDVKISDLEAKDSQNVKITGNQTINGVKSFTQKVTASISGNAGTATKLETSRKIDGKNFDGTKDIVLDVVHNHGDENIAGIKTFTEKIIGSITGTADKAVALVTGRKLKVKLDSTTDKTFNGTADVTDIGVSGVLQIANGGTGVSDGTVNTTAWAYSADGVDRFTTVYPNLNLLDGTKDFSDNWTNSISWVTDGTYKGLTVKKRTAQWNGIYKTFIAPKDGSYTFSSYVKSSGNSANIFRYAGLNSASSNIIQKSMGNNFDWTRDVITLNLKANDNVWIRYEISGAGTDSILWNAGHKWENSSTSTPYMPSTSEVTTADWPSYIGYSNTLKLGKGPTDFTWTQVFTEKSVVPITNGGTGASTRANAFANLATIPYNSVTTTDLDNTANWVTLGNGIMGVSNVSGRLYPTAYGKVINFVYGSNVSQLFISEASGSVYHRQGNAIGWNGISGVVGSGAWIQLSDDSTVVHNTGDETIAGVKSFTQKVNASISGNAGTATKLETSRKIDGKNFDGTKDIVLDVVHNTGDETIAGVKSFTQKVNASISGNAGTATKLETSRKIDGKNFDGTKDIVLDVVHNHGDENIAGAKTFTDTLIANYPIKGNTQRYYIEDGYDLNGYTYVGDFILNGANNLVNYPNAASTYASLHVEKLSGNTSIQTLTDSNHRIFTRIYGGNPSSFGEWRMIDSPYRLVPVPSYIGSFYSLLDFQKKEYGLGTTVIYSSVNISYNDGPHTVSNTFKVTVDLFNWKNGNLSNIAFIKVEEPNSIYRGYYDHKGFSGWSKQTY
ncbi:hypothetical protein P7H71_13355 [Lactococcus lactis]|nr:hypothetical protein [Lactococcus lactis]